MESIEELERFFKEEELRKKRGHLADLDLENFDLDSDEDEESF